MQRQHPQRMVLRLALLASALCLLSLAPRQMNAQATAARTREAGVSAFGMYSRVWTDYDIPGNGYTFGGDYTRFYSWASPSVEFRFKKGNGRAVNERTIGGGIRVERSFRYFRPYADFLLSSGTITFAGKNYIGAQGTGSNGSIVYSLGGGLDYDISDRWSIRVDYQHEHWNVNKTPLVELTPVALSFGVRYRFSLHRKYQ